MENERTLNENKILIACLELMGRCDWDEQETLSMIKDALAPCCSEATISFYENVIEVLYTTVDEKVKQIIKRRIA